MLRTMGQLYLVETDLRIYYLESRHGKTMASKCSIFTVVAGKNDVVNLVCAWFCSVYVALLDIICYYMCHDNETEN